MNEYRVVWQREGLKPKRKRYATLAAAQRFMGLLGPEPWVVLGKDPDALWCCSGWECACRGVTNRQNSEDQRANMPKLLSVRLDEREVGPWRVAPGADPDRDDPGGDA